jgi:catechol 2,3-dioxygenase-like lactoylglutathione lyase family enzyme
MVRGMALTAHMVTIDCADPKTLAGFWSEALGYVQVADLGGYLILRPADGSPGGLTVSLQEVPEPKVGKNRVHLDLEATDRTAEVARLVDLGAIAVREHTYSGYAWTVLEDPEGNVFCVSGPPSSSGTDAAADSTWDPASDSSSDPSPDPTLDPAAG